MSVNHNTRRQKLRHISIPVAIVLIAGAALVTLLLLWAAVRNDRASFEQQRGLVAAISANLAPGTEMDHEDITILDEVVLQVRKPVLDYKFLSTLFGPEHYLWRGEAENYLLDPHDKPYYLTIEGVRRNPSAFEPVRKILLPLVRELRRKMRDPEARAKSRAAGFKTPGVTEITIVRGKMAVISIKLLVSTSGRVVQEPGTEHVNIQVYRLDTQMLRQIAEDHHLQGVRFSVSNRVSRDEFAYPIVSPRSAKTIGYFIWKPFTPGWVVFKDMIVPFISFLLLFGVVIWVLIRRLGRTTDELLASEAQARHLAFHDVLTGLPNRALFEDRLERALAAARHDPDQKVALLCLDLDRFKQVNDTLGHPAGDELIRELGRRLSNIIGENDTVARLGGDEFAIIQTHVQSRDDIETLCDRILATVNEPFDVISSQVFVGMSIGVARSDEDGFDRTELTRKADIALYRAKSEGRGRYEVFATDMDANVQARQALEQDLRNALEQGDQLEMYYQPQYDAASGKISGVEALMRWHHPEHGLVYSSIFIPIAEETGLIEPLGQWALKQACVAAHPWPGIPISLNISAMQLRNPFFAQSVIDILHETGLAPERLELEITETSFIENVEQCQANLKLLRFIGVRIALDDFGSGYSSFNNLNNYNVDRLKIDRSFTNAIEPSADGNAIIRAIVELARSSGLKVTAKGVETVEQSEFLSAAGCDELQGFLMSRPIPLGEIDQMLGIDRKVRLDPKKSGLAA